MKISTIYVVSHNKAIYDDLISASRNFPNLDIIGGGSVNDNSLKEISIGKPDYVIIQDMKLEQIKVMLENTENVKILLLTDFYDSGLEVITQLEKEGHYGHLVLDIKESSAETPLQLINQDAEMTASENKVKEAMAGDKKEETTLEEKIEEVEKKINEDLSKDGNQEKIEFDTIEMFSSKEEEHEAKRGETTRVFNAINSKTIAVHSRKGGVGKTTIAKELANAYASLKLSKRANTVNQTLNVCLVDLDFNQGSLRTNLGIDNQSPNIYEWVEDIVDRLKKGISLDMIRYDKLQVLSRWARKVSTDKNVFLIHTPQGDIPLRILKDIEELEMTDAVRVKDLYSEIIKKIISSVQKAFDIVILDTETSLTETTFMALMAADNVVIPVHPTISDVDNLKVLVSELKNLKEVVDFNKFAIVVNNNVKKNGLDSFDEVLSLVKYRSFDTVRNVELSKSFPIVARMPYDERIIQANNLFLFYGDTGGSEFKKGILTLAEFILPIFKIKKVSNRSKVSINKKIKEQATKKPKPVRKKRKDLIVKEELKERDGEKPLSKKEIKRQKAREKIERKIKQKQERAKKGTDTSTKTSKSDKMSKKDRQKTTK